MNWFSDGKRLIPLSIAFAVIVFAWMARYELMDSLGVNHRNRFTGAVCSTRRDCWFSND